MFPWFLNDNVALLLNQQVLFLLSHQYTACKVLITLKEILGKISQSNNEFGFTI
jgi:hypothetical protein